MGWAWWAWLLLALAFLVMDPNAPKRASCQMASTAFESFASASLEPSSSAEPSSISPKPNPSSEPSISPEQPAMPSISNTSSEPSISLSSEPSISLSSEPSISLSFEPSISPFFEPSTSLSFEPSISPFFEPSTSLSSEPSISPFFEPSTSLSFEPSISPFFEPSTSLSSEPFISPETISFSGNKMTLVQVSNPSSYVSGLATPMPLPSPESSYETTTSAEATHLETTLSIKPSLEQSTAVGLLTPESFSTYSLHVISMAVPDTTTFGQSSSNPTSYSSFLLLTVSGEIGKSTALQSGTTATLLEMTSSTLPGLTPSKHGTPINTMSPSNPPSNVGRLTTWQAALVGVGTALGVALVVFIIIIGICWVAARWRYDSKGDPQPLLVDSSEKPKDFWSIDPNELGDLPAIGRRRNMVEMIKKASIRKTQSKAVTLAELEILVSDQKALEVEFASIPKHTTPRTDVPLGAENKNRYMDVVPNPHTRVGLFLKFGAANSDYINANYIQGHDNNPKAYIATQGPLPWTVGDFWRMVWEQKSCIIIMAADLKENGTPKCAQYWPDERITLIARYDDFEVRLNKKRSSDNYTTRCLQLKHLEKGVCRDIFHFWFSSWPDNGVLHSSLPLVKLLQEVRGISSDVSGPVVVHCSAGVGRTGVIIGVDIGMHYLEEEGKVDILGIVSSMRQDRGGMVQTLGQYVFIHETLLEYGRQLEKQRSDQSRPLELCESAA